jgi:hypothetical protein
VRSGIGAVGNAVAIDVEVAAEIGAGVERFARHHLAAVVLAAVVPGEGAAQPLVHADVEVAHDEDRRLQPFGEVERLRRHLEALAGVFGKQQDVLGVAVRGVGAGEHVGLLRARRHAGRRAAALDVDQHRRDLGEVGEADELGHQRDAGAGGGGERARAVPAGADDHADRCQLVFGLDDAVALLAGDRVGTQLLGIALEGFGTDDEGVIGYQAQTVAPP